MQRTARILLHERETAQLGTNVSSQNPSMTIQLCTYDELTPLQHEGLRAIEVEPEQMAFSGDIHSALHSLPAHSHPDIQGFTLLKEQLPVAFLLLKRRSFLAHWADSNSATLHAFQVDKRLQGQGLGKVCLQELRVSVKQLWPEISQLMLSVSPLNAPALAFYLSQGWVECGEAYRGERCLKLPLAHSPNAPQHAH